MSNSKPSQLDTNLTENYTQGTTELQKRIHNLARKTQGRLPEVSDTKFES